MSQKRRDFLKKDLVLGAGMSALSQSGHAPTPENFDSRGYDNRERRAKIDKAESRQVLGKELLPTH